MIYFSSLFTNACHCEYEIHLLSLNLHFHWIFMFHMILINLQVLWQVNLNMTSWYMSYKWTCSQRDKGWTPAVAFQASEVLNLTNFSHGDQPISYRQKTLLKGSRWKNINRQVLGHDKHQTPFGIWRAVYPSKTCKDMLKLWDTLSNFSHPAFPELLWNSGN